MNELKNTEVRNVVHLKEFSNRMVQNLVQIRKEAGFSQEFIAEWLKVDRRKIMALENGALDIELLCQYADKLDIDIYFNQ